MRAGIHRLAPGLLLTLLVCTAAGQEPRQTFRTATQLVQVHVVATDRAGRAVPGLTRDDFTILEDRVPQAISIFEVNDTRSPSSSTSPDASSVFAAPGAFSNRVRNTSGSTVVLLLDRVNAAFDSQWFARRHLDQYLSRMRSGDRVALYVLDRGIRVLHDFSDDARSLRRALDAYQVRVTGEYVASNEPPVDLGSAPGMPVWIVDPSAAVSEFYTRQRFRSTFRALQVLADHLSGVAGRKTVVWISEVFRIPTGLDRPEFLDEMRKTNQALNDAQASLYPVDARGLVGAIAYASRGTPRFTTLADVRGNLETMEVMAEDTGGRAFGNSNALDVSIARAIDDARLTYVLGYYPTDTRLDGRFRSIEVRLRKEGLRVRSRRGYVAMEPALDPKGRDAALRAALQGPLAATQVGLSAEIETDNAGAVTVKLRIDPATLTLDDQGGQLRGTVDLLVAEVSRLARGTVLRADDLDVSIQAADRAEAFQDGIPFTSTVRVTRYLHELRILARDVPSGRVGSLVIPAARLSR
jgi:VWFA-related protein